jgi:AraC-like DNA-binding protein
MHMAGVLIPGRTWEELAAAANYRARELARLRRVSDRHLRREMRRCLGRSPQDWLNDQRLLAARQLLLAGLSIKAVAIELGFKHTSHFCRQFKAVNAMTPTEFVLRKAQTPDVHSV